MCLVPPRSQRIELFGLLHAKLYGCWKLLIKVMKCLIKFVKVDSEEKVLNILTKGLTSSQHSYLCTKMRLFNPFMKKWSNWRGGENINIIIVKLIHLFISLLPYPLFIYLFWSVSLLVGLFLNICIRKGVLCQNVEDMVWGSLSLILVEHVCLTKF